MVWKDSYALFSNAIQAQPRDPIGYVNLGTKYKEDGDLKNASALYAKAIEIAPHDYIAQHNLAHIYVEKEQWVIAEGFFLKALKNHENYHPSMKMLAELYRTKPELYDLNQSLIYTKRYNKAVSERDTEMLGVEIELLLKLKKYEEARSVAKKLLQHPNLTPQAKEFINAILSSNPTP